tara:strand:- start:3060 stop:4172 length:1113 start_codon:yes stop_codon:yes gene_type:complete
MQKINIALLSPAKNAYSETFIQAHKQFLKGSIFYYFGGELPTELEGGLLINSRKMRIIDIFKGHYRLNKFSLEEQALITSFKLNKIDLVFAEYGGTGEKILPICKKLNLPLIVHFHGFDAARKDQLEKNHNYKEIFNYASYIVAVSKKMEKELLAMGCPQEKLVLNVYGPRQEFLEVVPGFSENQFIAVGRFVDKKAPYYLIMSFLEVVKKFPKAKLIIAGEGELFNTCGNLISFYKLEQNIELVGVITAEKFRGFLRESLAFVQHSIITIDGDSEGSPVVILEASAAGLPVISTNHAGIPELVIHEQTGLLSEEHEIHEMANNMLRLLEDKNFAIKLGEEGKKHILKNFTLKRHIATLNDLIEKSIYPN